jgi:hypothetical protein
MPDALARQSCVHWHHHAHRKHVRGAIKRTLTTDEIILLGHNVNIYTQHKP